MNIEQLKQIAIHHAKLVRTRCEFYRLSGEYNRISDNYMFYAYFQCKRNMLVKRIVLSFDGELIDIIN